MDFSKKLVYVQDIKVSAACPLRVVQVKRYIVPVDVAHSFFADLHHGLSHFSSPDDAHDYVHITEVIHPMDRRATSTDISKAKHDAIRGLLERGTFSFVLLEEVLPDGNVLLGHFALFIKYAEDSQIKFKALYIID